MPEPKREQSQKDLLRGVLTAEAVAQRTLNKRVRDVTQYAGNTGLTPAQAGVLLQRQAIDAIETARAQAEASSVRAFKRQTGLDVDDERDPNAEDARRAAAVSAARGLEKQFRKSVTERMAEGAAASVAFAGAATALRPAVERTATTEVMSAWNGAARRLAARASVRVRQTWHAELDACEGCWGLDGQTVVGDEQFSEGDPPVHPWCKCFVDSSVEREADDGDDERLKKAS